MKTFLVEYQVTDRRRTKNYSRTIQAETMALAKQVITCNGGKVLKATRIA